ncbi:hypothetical protein D3C81_1291620 [compost metagenome]
MPIPALPARSLMPALFSTIRLVASLRPMVGVNVAVQVMPPSLDETLLSVPLATLRSELSKPVTASLKVIVTSAVSPGRRSVSLMTIVAVGRWLSIT